MDELLEKLKKQILNEKLNKAKEKYEKTILELKKSVDCLNIEDIFSDNLNILADNQEYLVSFVEYIIKDRGIEDENRFFINDLMIKKNEYFKYLNNIKNSKLTFEIEDYSDEYSFIITFQENYCNQTLTFLCIYDD